MQTALIIFTGNVRITLLELLFTTRIRVNDLVEQCENRPLSSGPTHRIIYLKSRSPAKSTWFSALIRMVSVDNYRSFV